MKNKFIEKAFNKEYIIFLHNGYSEFSYGISVNPVAISFEEYRSLISFISESNFQTIVNEFENSQDYDFRIPEVIAKKIGFSILTFAPAACCLYTSDEEREINNNKKKKMFEVIK